VAVTRNSDAVAPVRSSSAFSIWLTRHASTSIGALGRLSRQPFASLMIVLVIAVTLALPAAINVVVKNAQSVSSSWNNALDFSVYLKLDVSVSEAEGLARLIRQRADVESVDLVTADAALAEFKLASGFGDALDQLGDNPLPHALVVRPGPGNTGASLTLLQEEIGNLPETDLVQVDTEWVQRFHAILDIVRKAIAIGSASNAFVRRPFLWTGFWYGLLGGTSALALVQYGLYLLKDPVTRLAGLYQGNITVATLGVSESLTIIGVAVFLGLFASWVTAARHMRRIEPR